MACHDLMLVAPFHKKKALFWSLSCKGLLRQLLLALVFDNAAQTPKAYILYEIRNY
jgi:hypothetical protein